MCTTTVQLYAGTFPSFHFNHNPLHLLPHISPDRIVVLFLEWNGNAQCLWEVLPQICFSSAPAETADVEPQRIKVLNGKWLGFINALVLALLPNVVNHDLASTELLV